MMATPMLSRVALQVMFVTLAIAVVLAIAAAVGTGCRCTELEQGAVMRPYANYSSLRWLGTSGHLYLHL
jgi:hypothetical protein